MANYKIAYCGGVMNCDGYVPPSSGNVSSLFINGELNTSATNPTDADAFIFESGGTENSSVKLHIFKSCCSPRMKCTYHNQGSGSFDIITDNRYVWAEKILNSGGEETFIMTDYGKYLNPNGNNDLRIDKKTILDTSDKSVEFWFTNVDGNGNYTAGVGDIPSATTSGMFNSNSSLVTCEVPAQMRNIENYTFSRCRRLTSYTKTPDFIDRIGEHAFEDCTALNNIVIGLYTTLSDSSFKGCTSATTITWNNFGINEERCRMKSIPSNVFSGCTKLRYSKFSGGTEDAIVIPKGISGIGDSSFAKCSGISGLSLNDVTTIGNSAFTTCYNLMSISGFSGVKSVGDYAFYQVGDGRAVKGFGNLSGLTDIGEAAFEDVVFGDNSGITLTKIANLSEKAFSGAHISGNTKISTNTIGRDAFYSAEISGNVNISADTIEYGAFMHATFGRPNIVLYNKSFTLTLKGQTFGYSNISSVTFNTDVELISSEQYGSFENCTGLTSVIFNGETITCARDSFNNCPSLTSITFGSNITDVAYAGGCFSGLDSSISVTLEYNGVVTNLQEAFNPDESITFNVPSGLEGVYRDRYADISNQWGWRAIQN